MAYGGGGFLAGLEVAGQGFDAYDRAQAWQEKLKERGEDMAISAAAVGRDERKYADTRADAARKFKLEEGEAASKERHATKQDELLDVEMDSIRKGTGRFGVTPKTVSPVLAQANKNLDNARKAMAPYTASGMTPPSELTAHYQSALADVDRLSSSMGLEPAVPTTTEPVHPAKTWLQRTAESAGRFVSSFGASTPAAAEGGGRLRTATNPKTGQKVTEPYAGAWGP